MRPTDPDLQRTAQNAIVLHEDEKDDSYQASSRSIDLLIWHGDHDVAKAVTLLGPGVIVLPLLGQVSGVDDDECLEYSSHPKRAAKGGILDRVDMQTKFGPWDPKRLMEELVGRKKVLEKRLERLSNEDLQEEVHALQDWREKASGRLKTLERRAAWSVLGVAGEGTASQEEIKKAFKKRALELHPDKGGDAERFRLLQEMRDLLVEPKRYELEGSKEGKAEARQKSKASAEKKGKEDDEDESDFSEDSWDADEEFRKMFPKRKKRSRKTEGDDEDAAPECLQSQDFHRGKFEAARRKLHRQLADMWARAAKLSDEIKRSQTAGSGAEAMRQLRKFADLFSKKEVSKLKENDPKKAQRIFRRFLEQGSEVLCAAGAVDPVAAVSVVAMQVNCPLLQAAPSDELQDQCAALLQAISTLPRTAGRNVEFVESALCQDQEPFFLRLLIPDEIASRPSFDEDGMPGAREVHLQLPAGSTLGDLRAAALHMCGSQHFGSAMPRLFCRGVFIAGPSSTSLASLELDAEEPLQCLPSNIALAAPRSSFRATRPKTSGAAELQHPQRSKAGASVAAGTKLKATDENKENEEDAWFDDFFTSKAAHVEEQQSPIPEAAPVRQQKPEFGQLTAQERGKQAMADRLKAQRQAAENKKKLEKLDSDRKKPAQVHSKERSRPQRNNDTGLSESQALACLAEDRELQRLHTSWDEEWQHPCAGIRRNDGSAIFCGPCDSWICLGSPYDHRDFEIHCEKVGHYGWID